MRTKKEILEDKKVVWNNTFQTSGGNLAILEVQLDIRKLLARLVYVEAVDDVDELEKIAFEE